MKLQPAFLALLISLLNLGCHTIVTSQSTDNKLADAANYPKWKGMPYFLPKAKVRVDGTWNKDSKEWDVKVTPVIEPDESAQFILSRNQNPLFDDDVTIAIDSNGLLQTLNAVSEDKTVSAIADLVSAAANALAFGAGLNPGPNFKITANIAAEKQDYPIIVLPSSSFHVVLAPGDAAAISHWVSAPLGSGLSSPGLSNQFAFVKVELKPLTTIAGKTTIKNDDIIHGIAVRVPALFETIITPTIYLGMDLTADLAGNPNTLPGRRMVGEPLRQTLLLPDTNVSFALPINRRYLVKDTTKLILANGMLQNYSFTRPSLISGIVGVPKAILSALVPIPLQIRTTVLNNVKAQNDTRKIETELKDANPSP